MASSVLWGDVLSCLVLRVSLGFFGPGIVFVASLVLFTTRFFFYAVCLIFLGGALLGVPGTLALRNVSLLCPRQSSVAASAVSLAGVMFFVQVTAGV